MCGPPCLTTRTSSRAHAHAHAPARLAFPPPTPCPHPGWRCKTWKRPCAPRNLGLRTCCRSPRPRCCAPLPSCHPKPNVPSAAEGPWNSLGSRTAGWKVSGAEAGGGVGGWGWRGIGGTVSRGCSGGLVPGISTGLARCMHVGGVPHYQQRPDSHPESSAEHGEQRPWPRRRPKKWGLAVIVGWLVNWDHLVCRAAGGETWLVDLGWVVGARHDPLCTWQAGSWTLSAPSHTISPFSGL